MKRSLIRLALVAAAGLALVACADTPAAKPDAAPAIATAAPTAAVPAKSLVEMEYELRKLEIDAESKREMTRLMALTKFAADSGSDFAKGMVSGLLGKDDRRSAEPARQSLLQAQAEAERRAAQERRDKAQLELAKAQLDSQNSWWNRGLQLWDRGVDLAKFKMGIGWQKTQTVLANEQERYRLDTVRGAQGEGFSLGSGAALGGVSAGSGATLNGVAAGRTPATTATEPTPAAE